jgi:hypothetical protein
LPQKPLKELNIPPDIDRLGDYQMRVGTETVLQFYLRVIAGGTSPKMAEILALQQAPGIGITDTIFIADQNRHGRSILDRMNGDTIAVENLRKGLARNGYRLRSDDHYIPTAARFANDPLAVVNNTQTATDLRRRIASRGTEAHGFVEQAHRVQAPKRPRYRLNPRIVNRIDQSRIADNPDLARVPVQERHAKIVETHGSKD